MNFKSRVRAVESDGKTIPMRIFEVLNSVGEFQLP